MKTYTSPTQLGLNWTNDTTIAQVCTALPAYSLISYELIQSGIWSTELQNITGYKNGALTIIKTNGTNRCTVIFSIYNGGSNVPVFLGHYSSDYGLNLHKILNGSSSRVTDGVSTATFTALENKLFYKSGDTYTESFSITASGLLTSSRQFIRFTIILPKLLTNITSVTINALSGQIRTPQGGYLVLSNNSSREVDFVNDSYVTSCIVSQIISNSIIIDVNLKTKIRYFRHDDKSTNTQLTYSDVSNNVPISVSLTNINLKFT